MGTSPFIYSTSSPVVRMKSEAGQYMWGPLYNIQLLAYVYVGIIIGAKVSAVKTQGIQYCGWHFALSINCCINTILTYISKALIKNTRSFFVLICDVVSKYIWVLREHVSDEGSGVIVTCLRTCCYSWLSCLVFATNGGSFYIEACSLPVTMMFKLMYMSVTIASALAHLPGNNTTYSGL